MLDCGMTGLPLYSKQILPHTHVEEQWLTGHRSAYVDAGSSKPIRRANERIVA